MNIPPLVPAPNQLARNYLSEIPIELRKEICKYLRDEDFEHFLKLDDETSEIMWDLYLHFLRYDYYFWLNHVHATYPQLKDIKYIIGKDLLRNYLKLKNAITRVTEKLNGYKDIYKYGLNRRIYITLIECYLHQIPIRYLNPKIDIRNLYIKSLTTGEYLQDLDYGKMIFT